MARSGKSLYDWCIENSRNDLLEQWDSEKNAPLQPEQCTSVSRKKVWWKCSKGHSWKAQIKHRVIGTGCPVCANKVILPGYNDIATTHPELVLEWDHEKNIELSPTQISAGSSKPVWWKCKNGHSWKAIISDRVRGNGCPDCSKKKIVKAALVGGTLIPAREISGSRVIEGHNDLETLYPSLMSEWNYEKNTGISPKKIGRGSELKVWWKCEKGHSWQAVVSNRVKGIGCPVCSKGLRISVGEKTVFYYLKQLFPDAQENYHAEWLGKSELDMFIPHLNFAVEYDGSRWHKNVSQDIEKDDLCQAQGITLLRIRECRCPSYESSSLKYYLKNDSDSELVKAISVVFQTIQDKYQIHEIPQIDISQSKEAVYEMIYQTELSNSVATLYPHLLNEWDYDKNGELKPEKVFAKSKIKVWWKCSLGHSWQAVVHTRSNGTGCPICSGKQVLVGFNDLATIFPDVAAEWHPTKNLLAPNEVAAKSNKKVWWQCEKGHEWESTINNRTSNRQGCPICYKERPKKSKTK